MEALLGIVFLVLMILIFGRLILLAMRLAWGMARILLTLVLLPIVLIGLFFMGLTILAFPLLVITGILSLLLR